METQTQRMAAAAARRISGEKPPAKEPTAVRRTLAANVKFYREQLGFSQAKLGELCEMTQKRIWDVEATAKNVTLDTVSGLAAQLGKTEVELLTPRKKS